MTKLISGVVLAAGLLSAGCGGTEADMTMEDPSNLMSREDEAVVWCTNKSWRVDFYAEPELINVVGYLQCQCYRQQVQVGQVTNYNKLAYEFVCSRE